MNGRIVESLQHSNELSKKPTDAVFRDVRAILTGKEREKKRPRLSVMKRELQETSKVERR